MYVPVSKRKTQATKGYTPVGQRPLPSPTQPKKPLGIFDLNSLTSPGSDRGVAQSPTFADTVNKPGFTPGTVGRFAYAIPQYFVRSLLSTGLETPLGKGIGEIDPKEDFGKFGAKLLGEDPIRSLSEKRQEYTQSAQDLGLTKLAPIVGGFAVSGELVLDLWFGGGAGKKAYKDLIKTLAKETDPERVVVRLVEKGVAKDIAEAFAPKIAKTAESNLIEEAFERMAKLQSDTKYTPVASRTQDIKGRPVQEVPISKITLGTRGKLKPATFDSVTQTGIQTPVELVVKSDGTFKINDGFNRVKAAAERGDKTVPAVLVPDAALARPGIEDLRQMSDFTDYVAGVYKIPESQIGRFEGGIRELAALYGINPNVPNKTLANRIGQFLDEQGFDKIVRETRKENARIGLLTEARKFDNAEDFENAFLGGRYSPAEMRRLGFDVQEGTRLGPGSFKTPEGLDFSDIWKQAQELPELPKITNQGISSELATGLGQKTRPAQEAASQKPPVSRGRESQTQLESKSISSQDNISQKSKVVESSKKTQVSAGTYEANRTNLKNNKPAIQRTRDSINAGLDSLGKGADKLLGPISTRLKVIDPSLKRAIRDFEFKLGQNIQKDRRAAEGFLRGIKNRNISIEDYADLDLALKNGDATKINEIVKKYDLKEEFAKVRNLLDDIYERAESVGYDIGYEKNYFPRMISDSEGLLTYLQKGDDWSIIDEAIRTKETDLGRYMTIEEKANLVNTLIRGFKSGDITLSKTGAMKARRIDIVDAELNQFYRDSADSLLRYIDSTNDAIEARRFFGKGNKADQFSNIDDSIGSYILKLVAEGKVKPSQEKELRSILGARFAPLTTSGVIRVYKNLSYIDTMGSVTSAITQLGDLAFAIYKGGPFRTIKAFTKALIGKSDITRADIGIEKIAQEFSDSNRSANAVSKVFKLVGLEKLDALGKESVINASVGRLRSQAKNPTAPFLKKIESIFGNDPVVVNRVIDDLKTGKMTEDTKLIAFNELLDVQPVALSEMPEQYLKGGNGRIFYMLKTYTIKLFDVYRNEVFQVIRQNPVQGIKNLIALTSALLVMNATADEIKDLILNRETPLKDRVVDNILKLAGFSKFTIYKAREEGIGSAVAKTILPPFKFIDSTYKDIVQANEISQLETIQSIPIGGKLYYWWFGRGKTKSDKKRGRDSGLPGAPSLPELPKLPQLPSLPKLPKI